MNVFMQMKVSNRKRYDNKSFSIEGTDNSFVLKKVSDVCGEFQNNLDP